MSEERLAEERDVHPENVRVIRLGHGANCSSIGSVVDTLFMSALVGGAILAAVLAAMKREGVSVVGGTETDLRPEGVPRAGASEEPPPPRS